MSGRDVEPRCPHLGREDEHCPCVDPGNENGPELEPAYPVGAVARYDRAEERAGEALAALPKGAKTLLDEARAASWRWVAGWREDTSGSAFLDMRLSPDVGDVEIRACWHTRDTGTPRLFHPLLRRSRGGWRDCTLTEMRALIAGYGPALAVAGVVPVGGVSC